MQTLIKTASADSKLQHWIAAARPATLTAAFVPVAVGTACAIASGGFRVGAALAALFGAACIQIGTNFANDLFDFEKGADTEARLGPTRAVQAGHIQIAEMRWGVTIAFAFATLAGVYLTYLAGPVVILIGVLSLMSGLAYTGGPFPLGYHGLGDLFVFVFFGMVAVCGTALVQTGYVPTIAWWAAVPVGAIATCILAVNNIRDRETDESAGKRTLVVRFGRVGGVRQYNLLLVTAYVAPVFVAAHLESFLALLPWGTIPFAYQLSKRVASKDGKALNPLLVATAKLQLVFGVLFAIGIILPS